MIPGKALMNPPGKKRLKGKVILSCAEQQCLSNSPYNPPRQHAAEKGNIDCLEIFLFRPTVEQSRNGTVCGKLESHRNRIWIHCRHAEEDNAQQRTQETDQGSSFWPAGICRQKDRPVHRQKCRTEGRNLQYKEGKNLAKRKKHCR